MDVLLAAAESLRTAEINEFHARAGKIQKAHVKRKRGVFKCDKCPSVFGLRHNLLRHERTIHQGKRPFKCGVAGCAASFVQRFDLETHRASVHDKRKDHVCNHCDRTFSQRSNLQTHVRVTHGPPPAPQECPQCQEDTCNHREKDHHPVVVAEANPTEEPIANAAPVPPAIKDEP